METPGTLLRRLRQKAGMRQNQMAEMLGMSAPYLCDIELGHRRLLAKFVRKLPAEMREPMKRALLASAEAEMD